MNKNLIFSLFILSFPFLTNALTGDMPDKLACFSLDSIIEAEKTGIFFKDALPNTGIKNRGIYLNEKAFIRIPVYPSFRKDENMPELNLNARAGCLELHFKPDISQDLNNSKCLFYFKPVGAKSLFTAYLQNDKLYFQITDKNGKYSLSFWR